MKNAKDANKRTGAPPQEAEARSHTDVEQHVAEAKKAAEDAQAAAAKVTNEASKFEDHRRADKRRSCITIVVAALAAAAAIGQTVFQYWGNTQNAKVIETTRQQAADAWAGTLVNYQHMLTTDNEVIDDMLNDPIGAVHLALRRDPNCSGVVPLSPDEAFGIDRAASRLLRHYEKHFLATSRLNLSSDWEYICTSSKELRQANCHIDARLEAELGKVQADFAEAIKTCELYLSE